MVGLGVPSMHVILGLAALTEQVLLIDVVLGIHGAHVWRVAVLALRYHIIGVGCSGLIDLVQLLTLSRF